MRWGPQTYEEMLLGYVEYAVPKVASGQSASLTPPPAGGALGRVLSFQSADADRDGKVTKEEFSRLLSRIPAFGDRPALVERLFLRLDVDSSGTLSETELDNARELGRPQWDGAEAGSKASRLLSQPRAPSPPRVWGGALRIRDLLYSHRGNCSTQE